MLLSTVLNGMGFEKCNPYKKHKFHLYLSGYESNEIIQSCNGRKNI